jgi:hypothetical protein
MKPPYFGYFALNPYSKARTFDECLQECDGNMDYYDPIEDFLDHTLFKIFSPEGETHDFYVYCGDEEDIILSNIYQISLKEITHESDHQFPNRNQE